jgi:hypothetical protein
MREARQGEKMAAEAESAGTVKRTTRNLGNEKYSH